MTDQNLKKYQQKELNLRCIITDEKTRNFVFPLPRNKSQENWTHKNELIIDFGGQNKTENNKISVLLLSRITFEKTPENNSEKTHLKYNLRTRNQIISSCATNNGA